MKKLSLTTIIILFLTVLFSVPTTAQDFEGVIYFEISDLSNQGINEVPYMVKGNKGRMEINQNGQKNAMLMLPAESKMVVLIEQMQGYMEMDTNTGENDEEWEETEMTNTGETKTIAGRTCEVWRTESEDGTYETCIAEGMGTFMMPSSPMQKRKAPEWAKRFAEKGAMPLEVVKIKNGTRTVQMKATRIEEKSLSDDLFEVPDGYRDMSDMMKRMQQMRGQQ